MDFSLIIYSLYSSTNHCKQFNVHLIVNFVDRPASLNTVESFSFVGGQFSQILGVLLNREDVYSWMNLFSVSVRKLNLL